MKTESTRSSLDNENTYQVSISLDEETYVTGEDVVYITITTDIPCNKVREVAVCAAYDEVDEEQDVCYQEFPCSTDAVSSYGTTIDLIPIKPGYWNVKVVVYTEDENSASHVSSAIEPIEIKFPRVEYETVMDYLGGDFLYIWEATLDAATSTSKQEMGAWVYIVVRSDYIADIEIGEVINGTLVSPCGQGSVDTSPATTLYEVIPEYPLCAGDSFDAKYAIAFFHTHTPLFYCDYGSHRPVGFSVTDENWASAHQMNAYLYDYVGTIILPGHPLHGDAECTFTQGSEMRATPPHDYETNSLLCN